MEKPILLQKKKLIKPIEQALERIEKIRQHKMNNVDSIILEGLFALAMASFEHSLADTLKELFKNIPNKLDIKTEPITKSELIDGNPLIQAIENKINNISYKSLPNILLYFIRVTDIANNLITHEELNSLIEIKATRNLLIHNNLMPNAIYKEAAGPNRRNANNGRLQITQDYLFESLVIIRTILVKFRDALLDKYQDYTKIKALKNLFSYIFKTPVMDFDNEFEVDIHADQISYYKRANSNKGSLSSGERVFFDVWIAHTHREPFKYDGGFLFKLDNSSLKKMTYLIENLELLKT